MFSILLHLHPGPGTQPRCLCTLGLFCETLPPEVPWYNIDDAGTVQVFCRHTAQHCATTRDIRAHQLRLDVVLARCRNLLAGALPLARSLHLPRAGRDTTLACGHLCPQTSPSHVRQHLSATRFRPGPPSRSRRSRTGCPTSPPQSWACSSPAAHRRAAAATAQIPPRSWGCRSDAARSRAVAATGHVSAASPRPPRPSPAARRQEATVARGRAR
mmetsp:Transcript_8520/g.25596  ORF Transcript_8520/g.25596 Transcript_8520/m.25596 type:complete len:215 (-) Transcript_8520:165-809(-)